MENEPITQATPQEVKVKSVTVVYDKYQNGVLTNENVPAGLTINEELLAFLKPLITEEGWNITVE